MSKEITKWKRNCPKCGETVYHANERMLKRAIHENRPCRECSNPDRGKIKRDELRDKHYNPKTDRWFTNARRAWKHYTTQIDIASSEP